MQRAMLDDLFRAKIRDSGGEFREEEFNRFCHQLEKAFPQGTLDFTSQQIGMGILTKLTKVLRESKHIRCFKLYGNLIRDHGILSLLQLLVANPQVVILDIGCNDFSNQAVQCIVDMIIGTSITSLQLGATGLAWHNNKFTIQGLTDILHAVHEAQRVQCLGLSGIRMSVRQGPRRLTIADRLAEFIRMDQVLLSLSFANSGFTQKEMEQITMDGLVWNNTLKFLDIHSLPMNDMVGVNFLGSISKMSNLRLLNVRDCGLCAEAGRALASAILEGSELTIIDISCNNIGDEGFTALLTALLSNQTVTELNVSNNNITAAVSDLLARVIEENQVLDSLNLSVNFLKDEGAMAIADVIAKNEAMTSLSLASCKIKDEGAIRLVEALVGNNTLRRFKLSDNFLTKESGYTILEWLRQNEFLLSIDLSSSQIDHFVLKATSDLCIRNRHIRKETNLQPLKKQLVQLSIQKTKMPEAKAHLRRLENKLEGIEQQIESTDEVLIQTQVNADEEIRQLNKSIQERKDMIVEEEKTVEAIAADTEKIQAEFDKAYGEVEGATEKERILVAKLEEDCKKIDDDLKKFTDEADQRKEAMEKEIADIEALLSQSFEILKDPEQLRAYLPPEYEWLRDDDDPLFLVDQVEKMKDDEKKSSRKKKRKRSKSPPKGKKKKGKK